MDEVDKFQGDVPESQALFLDFLNDGRIGRRAVDVLVLAATSSDYESDARNGQQLPDFYRRFPTVVRLPALVNRHVDFGYLVAQIAAPRGIKQLSGDALCALAKSPPSDFQALLVLVGAALDRAGDGDTLRAEHFFPSSSGAEFTDEELFRLEGFSSGTD